MWIKLSGSILGKISFCGLWAIKPWEFPRLPKNPLFLRGKNTFVLPRDHRMLSKATDSQRWALRPFLSDNKEIRPN